EAELARELGVDLIVTDHHHPPARLPDAYAVVNPRRPGDASLEKELAGAGVALALARSLLGELGYALREDELLQLVALATVADVVPLRAANRGLVRRGLAALNKAARAGERPEAWATVVADPEWPAGIVGLAASRLVEDHGRPAVVIALSGDEGKGSCRSISSVHIAEALDECDDLLMRHGGHAMAAGF